MYRVFLFDSGSPGSDVPGELKCIVFSDAPGDDGYKTAQPMDEILDFTNCFCMHTKDDNVTVNDFADKVVSYITEKRAMLEHYIFLMSDLLKKNEGEQQ